MKTLVSVPYEYDVVSDGDRLYLDVCYGGIAMSIVRVELTAEEAGAFRADPGCVVSLARQVQQHGKRP